MPGLGALVPSYLSIDTDSRVVRLDTWSKVLAPGLRLGWVTAHPDMVDLMALALHASLNGPPGLSQVFPHFMHDVPSPHLLKMMHCCPHCMRSLKPFRVLLPCCMLCDLGVLLMLSGSRSAVYIMPCKQMLNPIGFCK